MLKEITNGWIEIELQANAMKNLQLQGNSKDGETETLNCLW